MCYLERSVNTIGARRSVGLIENRDGWHKQVVFSTSDLFFGLR